MTLEGIQAALEHLDEAIAHLRAGPSRSRPFRLGNDSGVTCFTTSAFLLWIVGYPDRAVARAEEAMALATRLQHPYTLAYALFHCGYLQLWLREPELVRKHALQLLQVVERYDFPIWRALGTCLLGMADAELGRAKEGLAQVEGIALYQELKTRRCSGHSSWPSRQGPTRSPGGWPRDWSWSTRPWSSPPAVTRLDPRAQPAQGRPGHRGWRRRCRRGALVPQGIRWCR